MKRNVLAICVALVLVLAACQTTAPTAAPVAATQPAPAAQPFVVGMEVNYAPFNWKQTDDTNGAVSVDGGTGYAAGYDVEIAKRIAEGLGRPLVVKQVAWEGLVPALQNGAIDAVIAGMSETPERLQSVNFTAPYYESAFVMLVRADGPYASATRLSNFSGARVIGQKDTNYDVIIPQIEGVDHLTPLTSVPLIVQAILSDVADASPVERPVGLSISLANPQLAMVVFEEGQGFGPQEGVTTAVSVALRKTDTELQSQIDAILASITQAERETLMETAVKNQPVSQ
jgi:putative lysine transport system substrate-binding protein